MNDLSNKALAVVLLSTVIVSLAGTFLVINNLNNDVITGRATTQFGTVNLSVASTISITTADSSLVNFGSCELNESGPIYFNSLNEENTTQYCSGGNLPNNISVRNNGNVLINVSIATSTCAPGAGNESCAFLNVSTTPSIENNSLFQYMTINAGRAGYNGGCSTPVGTWTSFNGTHEYTACTDLNYSSAAGGENSFVTDFRLRVPAGLSVGEKTATITYRAFTG